MSIVIKLSGLKIGVISDSDYIKHRCSDYLSEGDPDFSVSVTKAEIERERELTPGLPDEYYEFVCVYRNICVKLPEYDRLLVHSAVIDAGGRGYAFAAKSGVGKTTHIRLWKDNFDDVDIINGDKPIFRYDGEGFYACGTPWCGKEGYNINREVKLEAFTFLARGENNEISILDKKSAADAIFKQILVPKDALGAAKTLELCDKLLKNLPVLGMSCNMNKDAATTARNMLDSL